MPQANVLVYGGGPIHDWQGTQPHIVQALSGDGRLAISTAREDLSVLEADKIAGFDVLVFYNTLGELTDAQRAGLSRWLAAGKGYVGIHSAAESFRGDPDYTNLVGGYFVTHPRYRSYQVSVLDPDHAITRGVDDEFMVTDEQYIVDYDPRVHVLASALYEGRAVPVAWTKSHGEGRVYYLALGHDPAACEHEMFGVLLRNGTLWAAGLDG